MEEARRHLEFLPGFSVCGGTRPGYSIENANYSLSFRHVLCDGVTNAISQGYQCCYDWSPIMHIIMEAMEDFEDLEKVEFMAIEGVKDWFMMYSGWGLLSSLLDGKLQNKFLRSLQYVKLNWPFQQKEISEEGCWELVKKSYNDTFQSKSEDKELVQENSPFDELIPHFDVSVVEGEGLGGENGRKKMIKLKFAKKWNLEVNFVVEKKKSECSLVDVASKAVAKMLNDEEDIEDLEIPITLRKPLRSKVADWRWINSFAWNIKEAEK